jgi:hypothetical protein
MAGGPNAVRVLCFACAREGRFAPADRTSEGLETDGYACGRGHRSGVDWSGGAPERPAWPPSEEELAQLGAWMQR